MRRERLYETTRGLTAAVAAGVGGLLLWVATQVGTQTPGRYWAAMGIVAGAGLVASLPRAVTAWARGLRLRVSRGTLVLAFAPALVCVGWILVATQPGAGPGAGHVDSWSRSLGIVGLVHDLALWHGVLAFGLGLVLGLVLDAVPAAGPAARPVEEATIEGPLDVPPFEEEDTRVSLPGGIMAGSPPSR